MKREPVHENRRAEAADPPILGTQAARKLMEVVRSQHQELLLLAAQLVAELDQGGEEALRRVHRRVGELGRMVKGHLALEDQELFPILLRHEDGFVRNLVRSCMIETGALAGRVNRFVDRWSTPSARDGSLRPFANELREVLGLLVQRIDLENRECFVAIMSHLER